MPDDRQRAEIAARRLVGGDFSEAELVRAALDVIADGDPPRDRLVLARARKRAAKQTDRARNAWSLVMNELLDGVPPATFELWIEPLELVGEGRDDKNRLVIEGPRAAASWTDRRYSGRMLDLLNDCTSFTDLEIREKGEDDA